VEEAVRPRIILNMVMCDGCRQVLLSLHRHDFQICPCGTFTDGGQDYIRRGAPFEGSFTDLSIYFVDGKLRRAEDVEKD
jgi:hypothetical protein